MSKTRKLLPIDKKIRNASQAFLDQFGMISMHLGSYNTAITEIIPRIIETKGTIRFDRAGHEHRVTFSSVHYQKPIHREQNEDIVKITPKLCIDRKISYTAGIYVDITYEGPNNQKNIYKKRHIGDIPVMVHSELCNLYSIAHDEEKLARLHEDVLDVGGYFIVKGSQKVVVPQARHAHNLIHTYRGKKTTQNPGPRMTIYAETRSGSVSSHTANIRVGIEERSGCIHTKIPYIDPLVPIGLIFMALGVEDVKEMAKFICPVSWFTAPPTLLHKEITSIIVKSFEQSWGVTCRDDALRYIGMCGKKYTSASEPDEERTGDEAVSYAAHLINNDFLPHIGTTEESMRNKCMFFGYMIQRLLMTKVGAFPIDDRDHFANKRIHTSGMLIASQFYNAFRQMMSKIVFGMHKDIDHNNPVNVFSYITFPSVVTTNLLSAISSNKWGRTGEDGVSQAYDTFNRAAQLSFLRKFVIPMKNEGGKIEQPRHVHGSQWGIACVFATPEGKKVGLVQGFSMSAYITAGCDEYPVLCMLEDTDMVPMDEIENPTDFHDMRNTRVFVNGAPMGITQFPENLVNYLRGFRRSGELAFDVSIAWDKRDRDIRISTDAGRASRCVGVVEDGKLRLTEKILDEIAEGKWDSEQHSAWMRLMEKGYVEIIDKAEEDYMNVAVFPSSLDEMSEPVRMKYTHCELSPDMLEDVAVSTSPHNDHNQAPRNIYQAAMSHQAIGVLGNSQFLRRGKWHTLDYPQKPIVSTRLSRQAGFSDLPMGQNAMICVMPWFGLGQEDSIVMHKNAVDRGLFNSTTYISFEGTVRKGQTPMATRYEAFEIPTEETCNDFKGNAGKLIEDDKGFVYAPKGTVVQRDDLIIGMVVTGKPENNIFTKDKTNISVRYNQKWTGVVHSVQCNYDGEGYAYVRVVIAQKRKPVLGDKFAACHGQKGTVGALLPTEEMPFLVRQGYTPDVILNPLALPSRMTIGMLAEALSGAALVGSALKCPEFDMPLCLDGDSDRDDVITDVKWQKKMKKAKKGAYDIVSDIDPDGTPWTHNCQEYIQRLSDALRKMGIGGFANEEIYNPVYKIKQNVLTFSAPVFYQRLKHMVIDKLHSRARGKVHALTRQPTEGRGNNGGFKIGTMERDALLGQGIPYMVMDRMFLQSDEFRMYFCKVCGLPAIENQGKAECRVCGVSECSMIAFRYGTKLVNQEFMVMNMVPRIIPKR